MEYFEQKISIKSWAEDDKPREKLALQGRRALSDAELMATLIGSGNKDESAVELCKRILYGVENDFNRLARLTIKELSKFKGIGEAKATSIIAALELGRRRKAEEPKIAGKIKSSRDIYECLRSNYEDLNHEEFWIVLVTRACTVISKQLVSKGGQSNTIVDPKIIFQIALEHNAASIILSHNHPSGSLKPSQADLSLTHKICSAGALLDITIIDHVIFNNTTYLSFADEGII